MADGDVTGLTDDEIEALTDEERDSLNDQAIDPGPDAEPEEEVDVQAQFLDWVVEHFSIVEVVGSNKRFYWCAQWFEHKEVVARLVALWKAHLAAELGDDLGAVSSWWINDWDRHAAVLFDPANGPFRFCDRTRGHLSETKETGPAVSLTIPPAEWQLPA